MSVILELPRGADLESTSRKHRVTLATLTEWRDRFLAGGEASLKNREGICFARSEIEKMGPLTSAERLLLVVFLGVCGLWMTSGWHGLDVALPALLGSGVLLTTGILTWEEVKNEKTAWDLFVWYGGVLRMGKAHGEGGVPNEFAKAVRRISWRCTRRFCRCWPPPQGLVVYAFACFSNLAAGLTHYGTTPTPMFFAHGYVDMRTWWKVGFAMSLANLAVWSLAGFSWWKLIGIW